MAFGYYKSVTVDHTQCGTADSSNFPVAIWVTDADLATVANGGKVQNANGYDIRPYADSTLLSALTYELVSGSYNAVSGSIEMHVKLPTLAHASDTVFYLAFGDSGISTDGSSTSTWSNSFNAVWHLGTPASLGLADSTANGLTLTNIGTVGATTGVISGGANFDPSSSRYLSHADTAALSVTGDLTLSCWAYLANSFASGFRSVIGQWEDASGNRSYILAMGSSGAGLDGMLAILATASATYIVQSSGAQSTFVAGWHHFAMTRSTNTVTLYVDGASSGTPATASGATTDSSLEFRLGDHNSDTARWDGKLDEGRLIAAARSSSWLLAEYNNQKPSSTFLTWGALTPVGSTFLGRLPLMGAG